MLKKISIKIYPKHHKVVNFSHSLLAQNKKFYIENKLFLMMTFSHYDLMEKVNGNYQKSDHRKKFISDIELFILGQNKMFEVLLVVLAIW